MYILQQITQYAGEQNIVVYTRDDIYAAWIKDKVLYNFLETSASCWNIDLAICVKATT